MKDKLFRAVTKLQIENSSIPLLYCSSTQMVNAALESLSIWPLQPKKELSIYNATVENVVVGCTTILNQVALELIVTHLPDRTDYVIMHDWWAYLSVSSFGKVIFDPEPGILYRQHGNNALGGRLITLSINGEKDLRDTQLAKTIIFYPSRLRNSYVATEIYWMKNPLMQFRN
ncbi:hypothetical protein RE628_26085 [Paenibacillus sp. D2_2]|uniref:hypothetical protein n=1 Tax=Paenibacillus sp. D2_2 TaxID=3073092 RepID=UPI0028149953|nr:hypothetical protein [Paenibacillus sp. D2_2]WMT40582.1 hypothetical protein RE628_26085 [Paenibacillus sp. D2_2]